MKKRVRINNLRLFFETKFYYFLGKKRFDRVSVLLDRYLKEKGETAKYFEYCFDYYYEINDYERAIQYIVKLINKKSISLRFENWIIEFFVEKKIVNHQYQIAAKNAMRLANLENLSTKNRAELLRMLDYIKTKV